MSEQYDLAIYRYGELSDEDIKKFEQFVIDQKKTRECEEATAAAELIDDTMNSLAEGTHIIVRNANHGVVLRAGRVKSSAYRATDGTLTITIKNERVETED